MRLVTRFWIRASFVSAKEKQKFVDNKKPKQTYAAAARVLVLAILPFSAAHPVVRRNNMHLDWFDYNINGIDGQEIIIFFP